MAQFARFVRRDLSGRIVSDVKKPIKVISGRSRRRGRRTKSQESSRKPKVEFTVVKVQPTKKVIDSKGSKPLIDPNLISKRPITKPTTDSKRISRKSPQVSEEARRIITTTQRRRSLGSSLPQDRFVRVVPPKEQFVDLTKSDVRTGELRGSTIGERIKLEAEKRGIPLLYPQLEQAKQEVLSKETLGGTLLVSASEIGEAYLGGVVLGAGLKVGGRVLSPVASKVIQRTSPVFRKIVEKSPKVVKGFLDKTPKVGSKIFEKAKPYLEGITKTTPAIQAGIEGDPLVGLKGSAFIKGFEVPFRPKIDFSGGGVSFSSPEKSIFIGKAKIDAKSFLGKRQFEVLGKEKLDIFPRTKGDIFKGQRFLKLAEKVPKTKVQTGQIQTILKDDKVFVKPFKFKTKTKIDVPISDRKFDIIGIEKKDFTLGLVKEKGKPILGELTTKAKINDKTFFQTRLLKEDRGTFRELDKTFGMSKKIGDVSKQRLKFFSPKEKQKIEILQSRKSPFEARVIGFDSKSKIFLKDKFNMKLKKPDAKIIKNTKRPEFDIFQKVPDREIKKVDQELRKQFSAFKKGKGIKLETATKQKTVQDKGLGFKTFKKLAVREVEQFTRPRTLAPITLSPKSKTKTEQSFSIVRRETKKQPEAVFVTIPQERKKERVTQSSFQIDPKATFKSIPLQELKKDEGISFVDDSRTKRRTKRSFVTKPITIQQPAEMQKPATGTEYKFGQVQKTKTRQALRFSRPRVSKFKTALPPPIFIPLIKPDIKFDAPKGKKKKKKAKKKKSRKIIGEAETLFRIVTKRAKPLNSLFGRTRSIKI